MISFENKRGQLVVMTLDQALDNWEENTRDLGRTIKEFKEGFKKREMELELK